MKCAIGSTFLGLLFFSSAGVAGAGTFEVHQACVADGCFSGDAPGYPVTLSSAGHYTLTSNLELPTSNTSAIEITVDNVVLDLGGFEIAGGNVCTGMQDDCTETTGTGVGIAGLNQSNVVVRNGRVTGIDGPGVLLGEQSRVEHVLVEHIYRKGIAILPGGTVLHSEANFTGFIGIEAINSRILDSSVSNNGQIGISVTRSIVERAIVTDVSGQVGILDGHGSIILSSQLSDNIVGIESIAGGTSIISTTIIGSTSVAVFARGDDTQDPGFGLPVLVRGNTFTGNNGGNDNAQLGGSGAFMELGSNFCGRNTTCP